MIVAIATALGLSQKVVKLGLLALAVLAALGAVLWLRSAEQADDTANRQIGATEAVVAGQTQTLEQLESANAAEQNLRAGGERNADRYVVCLRTARTIANCERYNPNTQPE